MQIWRILIRFIKDWGGRNMIILLVYVIAGYWATGKTLYANKIIIYHRFEELFLRRLVFGAAFGWVLIPIAVLKSIFSK